jgi:hypothetical protein
MNKVEAREAFEEAEQAFEEAEQCRAAQALGYLPEQSSS